MISALRGYAESEPIPPDPAMVMKSTEYLEACNLLFEKGILSKKIIRRMDSPVISYLRKGFKYFTERYEKHEQTSTLLCLLIF